MSTPDPLVEGIHERSLYEHARRVLEDPAATEVHRTAAIRAGETCVRIGDRVGRERDGLVALLIGEGFDVDEASNWRPRQNHTIELRVPGYTEATRVADRMEQLGFERWEHWTGAAEESFGRYATQMTVARATDASAVVRLVWRQQAARSRLQRIFLPTTGDWNMVSLPRWSWPAYSLIRPVRLALERAGLRRRHEHSLGPFLATPDSLIGPLFEFGGVGRDDLVVDIGCGDGRLVVEAAARTGCRALGIEQSSELSDAARARAAAAGVEDLVRIETGDARDAGFDGATVAFMFLPIDIVGHLLGEVLDTLPGDARLIVHEQMRLPASIEPKPIETVALIADEAVTVAHKWIAGRR